MVENNPYIGRYSDHVQATTQAYLVTYQGAINFLNYFRKLMNEKGAIKAIDGNVREYLLSKNIFYGTSINLTEQDPSL